MANYRFSIQAVEASDNREYRLLVGLAQDEDADLIPAHLSAFAWPLNLKDSHSLEVDAEEELLSLIGWLESRNAVTRGRGVREGVLNVEP